jgi:hypothetical protein
MLREINEKLTRLTHARSAPNQTTMTVINYIFILFQFFSSDICFLTFVAMMMGIKESDGMLFAFGRSGKEAFGKIRVNYSDEVLTVIRTFGQLQPHIKFGLRL